jgi:hypothetical protein
VASEDWVEIAKGSDCTPAKGEISKINVVEATGVWAKIESSAGKDTVDKVSSQIWVMFEQRA